MLRYELHTRNKLPTCYCSLYPVALLWQKLLDKIFVIPLSIIVILFRWRVVFNRISIATVDILRCVCFSLSKNLRLTLEYVRFCPVKKVHSTVELLELCSFIASLSFRQLHFLRSIPFHFINVWTFNKCFINSKCISLIRSMWTDRWRW